MKKSILLPTFGKEGNVTTHKAQLAKRCLLWVLLLGLTLTGLPVVASAQGINDHWGFHASSFDYDGYNLKVAGHFYNNNDDYTIQNLSTFNLSLYDAGGRRFLNLDAAEGSLSSIVLPAHTTHNYTFKGKISGLDLSGYDLSSFSTTFGCDYQYFIPQSNPQPNPRPNPIPNPQPRPSYPCMTCYGQGRYTCKACGGSGFFDNFSLDTIPNKCLACINGMVTCWDCGGKGMK